MICQPPLNASFLKKVILAVACGTGKARLLLLQAVAQAYLRVGSQYQLRHQRFLQLRFMKSWGGNIFIMGKHIITYR